MATPALAEENSAETLGRCGSITSSSTQNFSLPVDMVEILFGWQNPLYRLMKGIPFGAGQSLSFATDGQELDGFGFPVFSPFGPGNGIGTLSGESGCLCPSCRFLVMPFCAVPEPTIPECATPCFDDPNQFCLYCVDENGNISEIGRYSSFDAWLAALQAQVAACNCGNNQSGGECGMLTSEVENLGLAGGYPPAICCSNLEITCYANPYRYRRRCYLDCPPPDCGEGKTCSMQSSSVGGFVCRDYTYVLYECGFCCSLGIGTCTGLDCPTECPPGFSRTYPSICIKYESEELKFIPYECKCL